uniref:Uncharacterized protein n=1 Tax=Rhizophora mucronata TaxID=61149 RepID=A0A2P2IRI5_RHIMU
MRGRCWPEECAYTFTFSGITFITICLKSATDLALVRETKELLLKEMMRQEKFCGSYFAKSIQKQIGVCWIKHLLNSNLNQ